MNDSATDIKNTVAFAPAQPLYVVQATYFPDSQEVVTDQFAVVGILGDCLDDCGMDGWGIKYLYIDDTDSYCTKQTMSDGYGDDICDPCVTVVCPEDKIEDALTTVKADVKSSYERKRQSREEYEKRRKENPLWSPPIY